MFYLRDTLVDDANFEFSFFFLSRFENRKKRVTGLSKLPDLVFIWLPFEEIEFVSIEFGNA